MSRFQKTPLKVVSPSDRTFVTTDVRHEHLSKRERRAMGATMRRGNALFRAWRVDAENHPLYDILGDSWTWEYLALCNQFTVSRAGLSVQVPDLEDANKWARDAVAPTATAMEVALAVGWTGLYGVECTFHQGYAEARLFRQGRINIERKL